MPYNIQANQKKRTIKSVAVHLISLHLSLELNFEHTRTVKLMQAAAERSSSFIWLDPPESLGSMTIIDVHRAGNDPNEHKRLVNEWGSSTWDAWGQHAANMRQL